MYAQVYADPNPRKSLTFLHLSDIHLDLEYAVGTLAYCDGEVCCRENEGYPTDPTLAAGQWGSLRCDLPIETL